MDQYYSIARRFEFCAGHRVVNHESKCRNIHGHGYLLVAHGRSKVLDILGRVIDFSELKVRLGGWIDMNWDHTSIFWSKDVESINALTPINQKPLFLLPTNPTAENMAHYFLHQICPVLMKDTGVEVWKVELWETPNCCATIEL